MNELETKEADERPLEKSPQERYVRFGILLGCGAYKTVYKAYDTDLGIDVAWNAIDIASLPSGEKSRIIQEVHLLQKLEHKNIINFYGSWFCKEKNQVVFITEIMTSGTLKSYIKRVQFVKWKIIKRWCIQILAGLQYLHSQNPPIIHRDLKCDNIFINGNTGDLRIGDLGLSTQMVVKQRAQSVLGTPEFMAPELYDENYDEKVDIYAFGMCLLEMVTKEVPYSECMNPAQIYKKVISGIRPKGLQRVICAPAKEFIELCLSRGDGKIDVTAAYLLEHPFLKPSDIDDDHNLCLPNEDLTLDRVNSIEDKFNIDDISEKLDEVSRKVHVDGKSEPNMKMYLSDQTITTSPTRSKFLVKSNTSPNSASSSSRSIPISIDVVDDHAADKMLATMPGNESEVLNNRVFVMDGRNNPVVTSPIDNSIKSYPPSLAESQKGKEGMYNKIVKPLEPPISSVSTTSEIDELRRRGKRHDIRATEDPDTEYSIILNLRTMINGKTKEIKFPFNLFTDIPHEVVAELAADVGIPEPEVDLIVDSISYLATEAKIKNLGKMDRDVWEDSPEPHSFATKVPIRKDSSGKNILRKGIMSNDNSTVSNDRDSSALIAAEALLRGINPPNGTNPIKQSIVNSNSGSPQVESIHYQGNSVSTADGPKSTSVPVLEEGNSNNPEFIQKVINYEGKLQIAQSAFDQRELSLEAAIRNEEEKHKREMERYKKKMEEFERKKHRAALARMQRMEEVAAEFKAEVQAEKQKRASDNKGCDLTLDNHSIYIEESSSNRIPSISPQKSTHNLPVPSSTTIVQPQPHNR